MVFASNYRVEKLSCQNSYWLSQRKPPHLAKCIATQPYGTCRGLVVWQDRRLAESLSECSLRSYKIHGRVLSWIRLSSCFWMSRVFSFSLATKGSGHKKDKTSIELRKMDHSCLSLRCLNSERIKHFYCPPSIGRLPASFENIVGIGAFNEWKYQLSFGEKLDKIKHVVL